METPGQSAAMRMSKTTFLPLRHVADDVSAANARCGTSGDARLRRVSAKGASRAGRLHEMRRKRAAASVLPTCPHSAQQEGFRRILAKPSGCALCGRRLAAGAGVRRGRVLQEFAENPLCAPPGAPVWRTLESAPMRLPPPALYGAFLFARVELTSFC